MSNKEENFVPYFKVKWSKKSAWNLEQGAYLSCGLNPEEKSCKIGATETNPVSKRYCWLLNKYMQGKLQCTEMINGIPHFNTGSIQRLLKERFGFDKEMTKVLGHMYSAKQGVDAIKLVSRAVYREAGRLIFQQYPNAIKKDVAKVLEGLPDVFNSFDHGHIEKLAWHQIEAYLKGFSKHDQKPVQDKIPEVIVDLSQLIEKM